MNLKCAGEIVKDFGIFFMMSFTVTWYIITKEIEKRSKRKSLATALLAEILAIKTNYKKVELAPWEIFKYNNIQSLEEEYMTVYHNSSDRISLFKLDDVKQIVTFYTHLKAHIDTLRVLAKEQNNFNLLTAGINIFGNIGKSNDVLLASRESFRETYEYALERQSELYVYMEEMEDILNKYLKKTWFNETTLYINNIFSIRTNRIKNSIKGRIF
jgi:hypothetical protein